MSQKPSGASAAASGNPVVAPAQSTEGYCARLTRKLRDIFADSGCALRATTWSLVAVVVVYVLAHCFWSEPIYPWAKVVRISEDGFFRCMYRDDILERFFGVNKINEWKQRIDEKSLKVSQQALALRRERLMPIIELVRRGLSHRQPPGVLADKAGTATDADYLSLNLPGARRWLKANRDALHQEKRARADQGDQLLLQQIRWEDEERGQLRAEVDALQPYLPFDWLYHEKWHWVVEVFFWCLAGVLANTFIVLIGVSRSGQYEVKEFLLLLPKAALAPILAIVVTAWWASGFSESKVNFLNLPYFLVFSFLLGFVTESLYSKIKELGNLIVTPAATASEAKLNAAAQREKYQFVHPAASLGNIPPAKNLGELKTQLRQVAKSGMERGLVMQLASTSSN
jgi:hypothetical protein